MSGRFDTERKTDDMTPTTARLGGIAAVASLALAGCGRDSEPETPQVITDKGTPFGDLLVPKLTSSVTDGAVGVAVDNPVTVGAEGGVLGSVTMVNEDGEQVSGKLSPDGAGVPAGHRRSAATAPLSRSSQPDE